MGKISFKGLVYPLGCTYILNYQYLVDFYGGPYGVKLSFKVIKSKVKGYLEFKGDKKIVDEELSGLITSCKPHINSIIDIENYNKGQSFEVVLQSYKYNGVSKNIIIATQSPVIETLIFDEVIELSKENEYLLEILSDFRKAIKYPEDSYMFFGRAIERMKQNLIDKKVDRKVLSQKEFNDCETKCWIELATDLNISLSYIQRIRTKAFNTRHGQRMDYTTIEKKEDTDKLRQIIHRYFVYTLSEYKGLDKNVHRLLS